MVKQNRNYPKGSPGKSAVGQKGSRLDLGEKKTCSNARGKKGGFGTKTKKLALGALLEESPGARTKKTTGGGKIRGSRTGRNGGASRKTQVLGG